MTRFLKKQWRKIVLVILDIPVVGYFVICISIGFGVRHALPTLRALETGRPCDHETAICQHEVDQAIKGCSGGVNAGAWVWRHGKLAVSGGD